RCSAGPRKSASQLAKRAAPHSLRAANKDCRMPTIDADGCPLHVQIDGRDDAPVLMLANSLGTDLHMWDPQMPEFTKHFRVVRYDRRGHGKSGAPNGPYGFHRLSPDLLAL